LWDQGIIALVMETKMAVKRWLSFNELTRSWYPEKTINVSRRESLTSYILHIGLQSCMARQLFLLEGGTGHYCPGDGDRDGVRLRTILVWYIFVHMRLKQILLSLCGCLRTQCRGRDLDLWEIKQTSVTIPMGSLCYCISFFSVRVPVCWIRLCIINSVKQARGGNKDLQYDI
jgi:hypothetical protein